MYEFTKKELRQKFKETEYGKKTNKWLNICICISVLIYILDVIVLINFINDENRITIIPLLFLITCLSSIISCYFDGKRDGAIEQFKRDIQKNKE